MEKKGLMNRTVRVGKPNQFDLQPLFDALAKHVEKQMATGKKAKRKLAIA